ncbi:TadE family protein [Terrabacter koreensis]
MEFAIVLPVLFVVIAGIVDFGRYFFAQIEVTNAAREGARVAIVTRGPTPDPVPVITDRVKAALPNVGAASITISPISTCATGSTADASVNVQVPFSWIVMGPAIRMVRGTWSGSQFVSSTGVMRCGG